MLPTLRRTATSVVCLVAVACASVAWMATVYLNTWADPELPSEVIAAVLADDGAREEVVTPLRERVDSIADSAADASGAESALDAVLADPVIRDRIVVAANSVRSGDVDTTAAGDELVGAVSALDPALADRLAAVGPVLSLPDVSPLASLRSTAQRWVWRLALVAMALFALAFAVGDRRMTIRRYGWWAVGTGATWWIVPMLVVAAARRWLPGFDATTSVVVDTTVGPTRPWAIGLAVSGVVVFIVGSVLLERASGPGATAPTDDVDGSELPPAEFDTTRPIPVAAEPSVAASLADLGVGYSAPVRSLDDVDVWAAYAVPAPPAQEITAVHET